MYFAVNSNPPREVSKKVYNRQKAEKAVISAFVRSAIKAGYVLSVHDGGEWVVKKSASYKQIMAAFFATDEERIAVRDREGNYVGGVLLVYGNDGYDVVADYSVSLEPLMSGKVAEVIDRLSYAAC